MNEIFSILSTAHARTNVILAGKRDWFERKSRSDENKLSNLTSFINWQSEDGYFNKNNRVNFSDEESKLKLSVVYNFFRNTWNLVLESNKGLYRMGKQIANTYRRRFWGQTKIQLSPEILSICMKFTRRWRFTGSGQRLTFSTFS